MQRTGLVLILFCFTITLPSCNFGICSWDIGYTQIHSKPKDEEVIGAYTLTQESKTNFANESFDLQYTKLELKADHNYVLVDVPSLLIDRNGKEQTFTKAGRWFVSCEETNACLIELEGVCVVPLCEKNHRISIPMNIGDPDECKGVVFEKTQ